MEPLKMRVKSLILVTALAGVVFLAGCGDFFVAQGPFTAPTPVISPSTESFVAPLTVTITDTNTTATIYYTTDGTTPTTSSNKYSAAFAISTGETIKAYAVVSGDNDSGVATATFTQSTTATPTFSPAPGDSSTSQSVTISDSTSGAVIHYTTDGTTPTASSTTYSGAITASASTTTIEAIAVASGYINSAVTTGTYTVTPIGTVASPSFTPSGGTYAAAQSVSISDNTSGAVIHYTTDGTTPTSSSTVFTSGSPLSVSDDTTIKAIGVATGYTNSSVSSATYIISVPTPVILPATGTYSAAQTVTMSDTQSGTTIYYTTDGTTPTTSSTPYTGGFSVTATTVVQAIAVATGYGQSVVASSTLTFSTTATQDDVYVINQTTANLAAFKLAGTSTIASANIDVNSFGGISPTALCVSTDNLLLYVGTAGSIYVYNINSDGSLSIGNGGVAVMTGVTPASMQVDVTNDWLIVVDMTYSTPVMYSYAKAPFTGKLTPNQTTGVLPIDPGTPYQLLIAPNNQDVYVTLGTAGVDILNFNPSTGQLVRAGTLQPKNNLGADLAMTTDYTSSRLFLTETNSNGIRVLSIGSQGELTDVLGSPFTTGLGPRSVALDPTGNYLYVGNYTDNTISGFKVSSTSGALTALTGSPYATGTHPTGLFFDKSEAYLAVVNSGGASSLSGSGDLMLYTLDGTTGGKLDLVTATSTAVTGTSDPTGAFAVTGTRHP